MIRNKFSFAFAGNDTGSNPFDSINNKLMRDINLSFTQKSQLANMVANLPIEKARELDSMLSGAIGAGIGVLIAKYLLNLGFGGSTLFAILGYNIANALTPQIARSFNPLRDLGLLNSSGVNMYR